MQRKAWLVTTILTLVFQGFAEAVMADTPIPEVTLRFAPNPGSLCKSDHNRLRFEVSWWMQDDRGDWQRADHTRIRVQSQFGPELTVECQAFGCINPRARIRTDIRIDAGEMLCRTEDRSSLVSYRFADPKSCRIPIAECLPGHAR